MMQVIPFSVNHVVSIDMREHEAWITQDVLAQFAQEHAKRGQGYSMVEGGCIVACGGVDVVWKGVGEAWTILSRHIDRFKLSLHKSALRCIGEVTETYRLHRVQAHVIKGDEKAMRWINRLGFHPEAVLTAYGPNREDYIVYARLT